MTATVSSPPLVALDGLDGVYEPTLSTNTAARFFNTTRHQLIRRIGSGLLPFEPIALGSRRYRWPTCKVADALGIGWTLVERSEDNETEVQQ